MELTARLESVAWDRRKKEARITLVSDSIPNGLEEMDGELTVTLKPYKRKRSKDANAMLWACIGEIAKAVNEDPWKVYLRLLKRYGKFTYIVVKENVVDAVKAQWRETEVVGQAEIGGQKAVQMICFFGSHTYDTAEFSKLLDGTISEMREMGLETPPSKEMQRALEVWNEKHRAD